MTTRRVRIFLASPSDVERERSIAHEVAASLNRTVGRDHDMTLEVLDWQLFARPEIGRPQQLVFDQLGRFDILVGVMWRRFGTPTGIAGCGTEEEIRRALGEHRRRGAPHVLLYFSNALGPPPKTAAEAEQMLAVACLREELERQGLVWSYPSPDAFGNCLREHLHRLLMDKVINGVLPLAPRLGAALDLEVERCRRLDVRFFTPNFLRALLLLEDSQLRHALDRCDALRAAQAEAFLRDYTPEDPTRGRRFPFEPIDLNSREDVHRAREAAERDGADHIDETALLIAVLETPGVTRDRLVHLLGEADFATLIGAIRHVQHRAGTPMPS